MVHDINVQLSTFKDDLELQGWPDQERLIYRCSDNCPAHATKLGKSAESTVSMQKLQN